jgi:lipoyl(octanoyl) transferase
MRHRVHVRDLGVMRYADAWALQEELFKAMVDRKIARRRAGLSETEPNVELPLPEGHMLYVEHPHVLTLGKSGKEAHLVASQERLAELGVDYFPINRGGDITYHGPGQLVGYPLLDLDQIFTDIGRYMRTLEEAIIRTCAEYGLTTGRIDGLTGVWLDADQGMAARKVAALGVKSSRWVTMHGFALNINTDLQFFDLIVPCGIQGRGVTSIAREVGHPVDFQEVQQKMNGHLADLFGWEQASFSKD